MEDLVLISRYVTTLFPEMTDPRPYKVRLAEVQFPLHHYAVRTHLLQLGWEEFTDWMICPYLYTQLGEYEVWFSDLAKAIHFKLSFVLED